MLEFLNKLTVDFWGQLLILLFVAIIFIVIGSFIVKSFRLSFLLLIDPGSNQGRLKENSFLYGTIQTILGILIIGAFISILTNKLLSIVEDKRLEKIHITINESFETNNLIRVRKYLKRNNLASKKRNFNLEDAEIKLEIGREDIYKSIRRFGGLRLRKISSINEIVIEAFDQNTTYGSFINRSSPITIISTQNYSGASVGHLSSTVAQNLNANYMSNELYSSGSPLKDRHFNFATNEKYLDMQNNIKSNDPLDHFINDLHQLKNHTKLFVYIGTSNARWKNDVHLMFRGIKGDSTFLSNNPIFTDLKKLESVYEKYRIPFANLGFNVGTHQELTGDKAAQLSNAIYDNWQKQTITMQISTKILWLEDELLYYEFMNELVKLINELD